MDSVEELLIRFRTIKLRCTLWIIFAMVLGGPVNVLTCALGFVSWNAAILIAFVFLSLAGAVIVVEIFLVKNLEQAFLKELNNIADGISEQLDQILPKKDA